jgi:hypothetical protein
VGTTRFARIVLVIAAILALALLALIVWGLAQPYHVINN